LQIISQSGKIFCGWEKRKEGSENSDGKKKKSENEVLSHTKLRSYGLYHLIRIRTRLYIKKRRRKKGGGNLLPFREDEVSPPMWNRKAGPQEANYYRVSRKKKRGKKRGGKSPASEKKGGRTYGGFLRERGVIIAAR